MNWTAIRADVRALLGDPTGGIYSDVMVDATARIAYHRVRTQHPEPTVIQVATTAGDDTVPLPFDIVTITGVSTGRWSIEPGTDRDVSNPAHRGARLIYSPEPQAVKLSRPIHHDEAGVWTIRVTRIPPLPSDQNAAWSLPDALEGAVLNYAAADLLKQRQAITNRRGAQGDHATTMLIDHYTREAKFIADNYGRLARMT